MTRLERLVFTQVLFEKPNHLFVAARPRVIEVGP